MTEAVANRESHDATNDDAQWWVAVNNKPCGPFSRTAIRLLFESQKIDESTLACSVNATEWQALTSFPDLNSAVAHLSKSVPTSSLEDPAVHPSNGFRPIVFYGRFVFPIWTGINVLLGVCTINKNPDLFDRVMNWWGWTEAVVEIAFAYCLSKFVSILEHEPDSGVKPTMTCLGAHLAVNIFEVLVTSLLLIISVLSSANDNSPNLDAYGVFVLAIVVLGNLSCFVFEGYALYSLWLKRRIVE